MTAFVESLVQKTLAAIDTGARSILVWGSHGHSHEVIAALCDRGFAAYIKGVVDEGLAGVSSVARVSPQAAGRLQCDIIVVAENRDKERALRELALHVTTRPKIILAGNEHLEFHDDLFEQVRSECTARSRAAGYPHMLIHLFQCLRYITARNLDGHVAEFGVYKGGTTEFIARTLARFGSRARIYAFDTFAGFPPARTILDMYADAHDEFIDDGSVEARLKSHGVEIMRGDILDTHPRLLGVPLALTFFDTDNYSPTKVALEMCYEQTVPGGVLAFDHYFCDERWLYTVGERIAINEVFAGKTLFHLHGTGIFIKA